MELLESKINFFQDNIKSSNTGIYLSISLDSANEELETSQKQSFFFRYCKRQEQFIENLHPKEDLQLIVSVRDCDKEGAFIFLAKCVRPRIAAYSSS